MVGVVRRQYSLARPEQMASQYLPGQPDISLRATLPLSLVFSICSVTRRRGPARSDGAMETAVLDSLCGLEAHQLDIEGLLRKHKVALERHRLLVERAVDRAANGSYRGSSAPGSPLDDIAGSPALPLKARGWSPSGGKEPSPRPRSFSWGRGTETTTDEEDSDDSETALARRTLLARAKQSFRDLRLTVTSNLAHNLSTLIEDSVAKKQLTIKPRNQVQACLLHSLSRRLLFWRPPCHTIGTRVKNSLRLGGVP
ncbi:unnamed protein product [Prorocentrum cordatum]|uniref:Uncharacterized protein n=1 Tax=Prorocentrum cordatum TaxID=2364126 RepID=A0ABN9TNC8_9DINO|nr:unnamed protein product [Polarella glacialis]